MTDHRHFLDALVNIRDTRSKTVSFKLFKLLYSNEQFAVNTLERFINTGYLDFAEIHKEYKLIYPPIAYYSSYDTPDLVDEPQETCECTTSKGFEFGRNGYDDYDDDGTCKW